MESTQPAFAEENNSRPPGEGNKIQLQPRLQLSITRAKAPWRRQNLVLQEEAQQLFCLDDPLPKREALRSTSPVAPAPEPAHVRLFRSHVQARPPPTTFSDQETADSRSKSPPEEVGEISDHFVMKVEPSCTPSSSPALPARPESPSGLRQTLDEAFSNTPESSRQREERSSTSSGGGRSRCREDFGSKERDNGGRKRLRLGGDLPPVNAEVSSREPGADVTAEDMARTSFRSNNKFLVHEVAVIPRREGHFSYGKVFIVENGTVTLFAGRGPASLPLKKALPTLFVGKLVDERSANGAETIVDFCDWFDKFSSDGKEVSAPVSKLPAMMRLAFSVIRHCALSLSSRPPKEDVTARRLLSPESQADVHRPVNTRNLLNAFEKALSKMSTASFECALEMHLFSLGSKQKEMEGESAAKPASSPPSSYEFRIGSHCFSLPSSVTSRPEFQRSRLGALLNPNRKLDHQQYEDGTTITRVSPSEIHIDRTSSCFLDESLNETPSTGNDERLSSAKANAIGLSSADHVANFALLVDHLLGRKPLEAFDFLSVADACRRLEAELRFWSFEKSVFEIPYRLWTRTRWTDLSGVYVQTKRELEVLRMQPVAIQLEDNTVQGVRHLKRINIRQQLLLEAGAGSHNNNSNLRSALIGQLREVFTQAEMKQIVAVFEYFECKLILLNSALKDSEEDEFNNDDLTSLSGNSPNQHQTVTPPQTPFSLPVVEPLSSTTPSSSPSTAPSYPLGSSLVADQLLVRVPSVSKFIAYDFPRSSLLKIPTGQDYPVFFRRGNKFIFCFSREFSFEIQELTDTLSGCSKVRCSRSLLPRIHLGSGAATAGVPTTPSTNSSTTAGTGHSSSVINYFKSAGLTGSSPDRNKRDLWKCFHPTLGAKYTLSKIKEFNEIKTIKLYAWGALIISSKLESPFAIASIDHPELKKIYNDKIAIYVRGISTSNVTPDDIDVTITAGLERVYLCCCGQIGSANTVPHTNRVDFEIAEQPTHSSTTHAGSGATGLTGTGSNGVKKNYKLRLVHLDIPEGAPRGKNLGFIHCLGVLAEFDPSSGLYYQNTVCKKFCGRYTGGSSMEFDAAIPKNFYPSSSNVNNESCPIEQSSLGEVESDSEFK